MKYTIEEIIKKFEKDPQIFITNVDNERFNVSEALVTICREIKKLKGCDE